MIKVIWVMVGGAVGSVLRIIIRDWSAAIPGDFPWGTFGVNILGAFLLGFFVTITVEVTRIRSHYRAGIAVGLFGGFTTFSTFMYEGVALIKDNETKNALLYVTLTMVLGIGAFALGWLTRLYL
ncbi:MAG: fluoride efflux transporter CrcB [Anaerovoracaceae bacterium]